MGSDFVSKDLGFNVTCDFPPQSDQGFKELYIVQLVGYGKFRDTNTSCARGLVLEKGKEKSVFTRYGYFDLGCDEYSLARLIRAFDIFDQSESRKECSYERRGNAHMY